uniref:Plastocyanin-like domain-containing protein n=1 Tax=Pavo cristatus TaxID=9049 RepID=A0A8C9FAS5_PAVCR
LFQFLSHSESSIFFERSETRIGGSYKKAIYKEYTDGTFTILCSFLGPVIKAEVGESIRVTFRNNASRPFSIQPHGVSYHKSNEGALYRTASRGAPVERDLASSREQAVVYINALKVKK